MRKNKTKVIELSREGNSAIDNPRRECYDISQVNMRKAMTETSSMEIADRESIERWKMLMWIVCENHSPAAMLKVDVSVAVYLR